MIRRAGAMIAGVLALATAAWAAPQSEYETIAAPFFRQHCLRCHGPEKHEARLLLHKLTGNIVGDASEARVWETLLEQLRSGSMPPKKEPRPPATDVRRVADWIQGQIDRARARSDPRVYPVDGNRLPHEPLFEPRTGGTGGSLPRLWRVSPMIYTSAATRLGRDKPPSTPFGLASEEGFKDFSSIYRVDEPETELLIANGAVIARRMIHKPKKYAGESQPFRRFIDQDSSETAAEAIRASFRQILQRDPLDEERKRFEKLLREASIELGREKGVETLLTALLLRPEVIFRFELGEGRPDAQGRRLLAPSELALAISYALTDREPDDELAAAARSGKLGGRDDVLRQVRRILDDSKVEKPRILRFFQEYFGYGDAIEVFKDDVTRKSGALHGRYLPEDLVEDTDLLVRRIVERDRDVLRELLTTKESFMSGGSALVQWLRFKDKRLQDAKKNGTEPNTNPFGKKNQLFQHYNARPEDWSESQPLLLPASQRSGILTQPSWLIAHSTNFENHAIRRGKWIRDRLLGGAIPDTPITVEAKLPEDPHKTLRERMAVTRESFCWNCHKQMDPLGFPFEIFDHFGRYRTMDLDKPVDASGEISGSGDPRIDGPVKDAVDLLGRLAGSVRAEQVFVRHAFRYWMGRNETVDDAPALQAAHRAYRENGGSLKTLLAALLTSDSFLYRRPLLSAPAK